ncbi:glutathione S-transferase family protein [Aspergillus saccharolyticus JOP 1030-1]|uniref:Putative glutathione S-transferase n=1 Tax=Aspergillus saccharolyticus JOP 1030-1 TaxID=1450539 RepID=A0A318Z9N4_9EURO|nr:putative glutathione S-transferase [Aspergillus saccharolyticus JOP 1030-1]PYH44066.1 putative glutathione S-transferase [Aspergillus saccharolyticus JOP 1030-1]
MSPKITLYTNRLCPWAHRAHIALIELGLDYEEVTIDLDTPREPWYLKINPRGLVPALSYDGTIILESAIIAQFLVDAYPSHLLPPSHTPEGALQRARSTFFVDTWASKISSLYNATLRSTDAERRASSDAFVAAVKKEIEPLIYPDPSRRGPFFEGSEKLTFVEVLLGSFLLRLFSLSKPEYGLFPADLKSTLEKETPAFKRWAEATIAHPSVKAIYNEEAVATRTVRRYGNK